MKYATPNWTICRAALIICWRKLGRKGWGLESLVPKLSLRAVLSPTLAKSLPLLVVFPSEELLMEVVSWPLVAVMFWYLNWPTMYRSYSLPTRRRNSRDTTRRMTPMHDPANMPLEVICHEDEMKPCDHQWAPSIALDQPSKKDDSRGVTYMRRLCSNSKASESQRSAQHNSAARPGYRVRHTEILHADPPILISILLSAVEVGMAIAVVLAIVADPMSMM